LTPLGTAPTPCQREVWFLQDGCVQDVVGGDVLELSHNDRCRHNLKRDVETCVQLFFENFFHHSLLVVLNLKGFYFYVFLCLRTYG
jgi:hypothetical protein